MSWAASNRRERLPADWAWRTAEVLKRDKYRCQLRWSGCFGSATEVDHKKRGDDHRFENLQAACTYCHARKSAAEGVAARAKLRALRKRPVGRHPGMR